MNKYLDLVLKHPLWFITGLFLVTVILGTGLPKLKFDASLDSMMPKRDKEYLLNEKVKKVFGNNGKFIIMSVPTGGEITLPFLNRFEELMDDVEEFKDYSHEREMARLKIFDQKLKRGPISQEMLIKTFKDDPAFQRELVRKYNKLFGTRHQYEGNAIKKFKKAIIKSYQIKKAGMVDVILSPYTVQDLIGKDDALITRDIVAVDDYGKRVIPKNVKELAEFKERLINNPAYEKGIYVRDKKSGKITDFAIMMRLIDSPAYDDIAVEMMAIASSYKDMHIITQGIPVVYHEINQYLHDDLLHFIPLVLLVVLIVFFLNFGTIRGVLLPFVTLASADIWVLGLMGHLGYKLTVVGVSLPPLMIAVGSSYAIHILNQYYIDSDLIAADKKRGLKNSMLHISLTVILAGLTTFLGFVMLITNQVSSIQEWGVFSALGVLFAVFISITFIPAVLIYLPNKSRKERKGLPLLERFNPVDKMISGAIKLVLHHNRAVVIVSVFIMLFSLIGMSKILVETSVLAYFKKGDYVLTSSRIIGEKFGGSYGLNILIDSGKKDGIKDPALLKFVDRFREWLLLDKNRDLDVGRTDAYTDFLKTMNRAMYDNDPEQYRIPDKRSDIESYINTFSGDDDNDDGRIDQFEPYIDRDYRTLNIFARLWEKEGKRVTSRDLKRIIAKISAYLDKNLPAGATYKTSGEPKIIVQLSKHVVNGQIMSLLFSLLAIGFISFLLFKNWKAGLVSLIPITMAVLFNFGIMGWFGFRLDLATAIIASIVIGIGIDDTIHFMNTFRHFRSQNFTVDKTIEMTLTISGRAIIYTSLALVFGFMILLVSNFKPVIYFGLLVAITMIATTAGALLVLPATIKLLNISLSESQSQSRFWKYIDIGKVFKINEFN